MKWLSNRYAYPLVTFVIIVSIILQVVWLNQLFTAQKNQVKQDLEKLTGRAAQMSTYLSEIHGHENSRNFKAFFLSPEWLQFRQAYSNMRFHNIGSRFNSNSEGDSTIVDISLRFANDSTPSKHHGRVVRFDKGVSMSFIKATDHVDQQRMDSIVRNQLGRLGYRLKTYHDIYDYDYNWFAERLANSNNSADFSSQQYPYNMKFLNTYQLVVPSVNGLVLYRMRYYLLSSFFLVILTITVFYFILRLMRDQRLYSQARISFTSNMTHELKTPVATIALAIESIIENDMENDPKGLRTYLEISQGELRRLNLMIDRVLNLEQMDNALNRFRAELFDVQQGISEVIGSMALQIENAGASINWVPLDMPCFVSGDPVHLTNVFYNLIENALKYGGEGVKLIISCSINTHEIKINFKDNGPGIDRAYQQQVFERYFRAPVESSEVYAAKGTGLGLNYVKQVIEKHGGHVKLESESGVGSNFTIYLPSIS